MYAYHTDPIEQRRIFSRHVDVDGRFTCGRRHGVIALTPANHICPFCSQTILSDYACAAPATRKVYDCVLCDCCGKRSKHYTAIIARRSRQAATRYEVVCPACAIDISHDLSERPLGTVLA